MEIIEKRTYPDSVTFKGQEIETLWEVLGYALNQMNIRDPKVPWLKDRYRTLAYALGREPWKNS